MARPGIGDLQVAVHARRQVQQEAREGVGVAVLGSGVGGEGGLRRVEGEPAAGAPVILDLEQEVAVVTDVEARLEGVIAPDLGEGGDHAPGPLRAVPGQAGREADHGVRVPVVDLEAADAAREVVEVGASDPQLGGGVEPFALGHRDVVVVAHPRPHVEDRARPEGVGPVEGGAEGLVGPGAGEAVVGRPAVDAVGPGVEDLGALEAEAVGEAVPVRGLVVELHVEGLGGLLPHPEELVVVLAESGVHVGGGEQGEDLPGQGADPVGGDHVAGEGLPPRPVRVSGGGVVDLGGGLAEVPVAEVHGRDVVEVHLAQVVARPLVVREEEELVLDDGPAQGRPELLVARGGLGPGEIVLGQRAIAVAEEERAPLELVGAGLEGHRAHRPPGPPELRVVVARAHAHGLDRVRGGDEHGEEAGLVVVVDPLEHHVVGEARLAVHLGGEAVLGVEELGVGPEGPAGPRNRHQEALEVPVEGQRSLGELLALDEPSGVGPVGLQHRLLLDDGDGLLQVAHGQAEVHAHGRVHIQLDPVAQDGLEAGELRRHPVDAVLLVGKDVVAARVGHRAAADVRADLRDGDGGAGEGRPLGVADRPEQGAVDRLGPGPGGGAPGHERGEQDAGQGAPSTPGFTGEPTDRFLHRSSSIRWGLASPGPRGSVSRALGCVKRPVDLRDRRTISPAAPVCPGLATLVSLTPPGCEV